MKKTLKVVLLVFLGLVVLVAIAIGLAFTPGVQRWALHKATANIPGLTLKTDRVLLRPTRVEIDGLYLRAEGTEVRIPTLRTDLDLWAFWKRKEIIVQRIEAKGVDVALGTPAKPAGPSKEPFKFPGILAPAQLPYPVTVARVELDGKFHFAGPGAERQPAGTLKFEGGGLAPGAKFTGTLQATVERPIDGSELERVALDGQISFQETTTYRIDEVTLRTSLAAKGQVVSGEREIQLALDVQQPEPGAPETASLTVELPRSTGVAARLVALQLKHDATRGVIEGDWQLQARRAQLVDFLRGRNWPDFDSVSSGKFSFSLSSGDASSEGTFTLTTGSLAGVQPELAAVGSLQIDASFAAGRKGDAVNLARLETTVAQGRNAVLKVKSLQPATYDLKTSTVAFAQPANDLLQVEITKLPIAWLKPFLASVDLDGRDNSGSFAVGAAADGSRVTMRALQPLTASEITFRQGGVAWVERATVSMSPRIEHAKEGTQALIPDFTIALPAGDKIETHIDVRSTGEGDVPTVGFAIAVRAQLPTLLKTMLPANAGGIASDLKLQGAWRGHELALQTVTLVAKRGNGLALAEVETRQPFTVFFDSFTVKPERAADPLARLALSGLPLEWARPWLAGWQLSGDLASGEVLVATDGHDNLSLETVRPIAFRDLRVAQDGKVYAEEMQGEIAMKARGSREKAQLETLSMDLRRGSESFLRFAGAGSASFAKEFQLEANGKFDADAVRLLALPPLAPYATLAHGRINGDFDVATGGKPRGKFALRGRELVGREGGVAWGNVAVTGDLTTADDGTMKLNIPLTVDNAGRKSALLFAATMKPSSGAVHATGSLTSDQLYLDDLRALATLARGVPDAESPPAAKPVANGGNSGSTPKPATKSKTPDEQPAWAGLTGRVDVDVKRISGEDYEISGLKTAMVVEGNRIVLEKTSGAFKDATLAASGELTFTAKQSEPYALQGSLSLPGFDAGAFFKALDPSRPPMLETVGTLKAELRGRGPTLPQTLATAKGTFELTAGKGVYRGLARYTEKVGTITQLGQGIAGLFGKGDKVNNPKIELVNEIAAYLGQIPFDQMVAKAQRGDDLKFTFQTIELRHPEVRIFTNGGTLGWNNDQPFGAQPQRFEFRIAVKSEKAKRWTEYLEPDPDAEGFYMFRIPAVVSGTVGKPDANEFWMKLFQTAGTDLLKKLLE